MSTSASPNCRKCGAPLPAGAADGCCTRCWFARLAVPTAVKTPLAGGDATTQAASERPASIPTNAPGLRQIGNYELLETIAEGGMGIVYKARDRRVHRTVALKMILAGRDTGEGALKRFRVEAEASAALDHPNIVPIYEVGETGGLPFFTMKLIEGGSLAARLKRLRNQPRAAAKLMAKVARAVHHAHQRGVLHRDLKPANILLGEDDEPYVTDFGLARWVDVQSDLTHTGAVMGTPNYMAPEQAAGNGRQLTTAADIFSLGAILYHLLAGVPPFQAESVLETLRLAQETEPVAPGTVNPKLSRDLETICLKCLEKAPANRYRSALELAEDLERWLGHETIQARRATPLERAVKWVRRKPVIAALAAGVVIATLGGIIGVFQQWRLAEAARQVAEQRGNSEARARQAEQAQRGKAEQAYRDTEVLLTRIELEKANEMLAGGNSAGALAHLANVLHRDPSNGVAVARIMSFLRRRSLALPEVTEFKSAGRVIVTAVSADGQWAASATDETNNNVRVWNVRTGVANPAAMTQPFDRAPEVGPSQRPSFPPQFSKKGFFMKQKGGKSGQPSLAQSGLPVTLQFSPDGRRLVTASNLGNVRIWEAATGEALSPPLEVSGPVIALEFTPDGSAVLALSREGQAYVWKSDTGTLLRTFGFSLRILAARFNADASQILAAYADGSLRIWDTASGELRVGPLQTSEQVRILAWSPKGDLICTVPGNTVNIWKPAGRASDMVSAPHVGVATSATFSPDGKTLVICGESGAQLLDAATGQQKALFEHPEPVLNVVFRADGQRMATISRDGTARLWDTASGRLVCEPLLHSSRGMSARFTGGDDSLLVICRDGMIARWAVASPPPATKTVTLDGVRIAQFSPDGMLVLTAGNDGNAWLWAVPDGKPVGHPFQHGSSLVDAIFSPDGSRVLTAGTDSRIMLWNTQDAKPVARPMSHSSPIVSARFSTDGSRVFVLTQTGVGRIWDAQSGASLGGGAADYPTIRNGQISPDGSRVVVNTPTRAANLYDLQTGERLGSPMQHSGLMGWASFSADGNRIITASFDNTARIWDAHTTLPLTPPLRHDAAVHLAAFTGDGRQAVTVSEDKSARLWDTSDGATLVHTLEHSLGVRTAEFSTDGKRLLTVGEDGVIHLWDTRFGLRLAEPLADGGNYSTAHFSPDGQMILAVGESGTTRLWFVPVPPLPAPEWLGELAEMIGGLRIDARGLTQPAARITVAQLRHKVPSGSAADYYKQAVQWLLPAAE